MSAISFWRFPEEEETFLDFLDRTGNVIAIPYKNFHSLEEITPRPLRELVKDSDSNSDSYSLLIGLDHWINQIKAHSRFHDGENIFGISYFDSPLIVYDRGRIYESQKLLRSNLCGAWSYVDDQKRVIHKSDAFIKWSKKVFAWVRKATPEFHQYRTYRLTPRVAEAIRNNLIEIVP